MTGGEAEGIGLQGGESKGSSLEARLNILVSRGGGGEHCQVRVILEFPVSERAC